MHDATDATPACELTIAEAAERLRTGALSARELLDSCLSRIAAVDGERSFDGSPDAINAWARIYERDAHAAAGWADERRSQRAVREHGPAPRLCGIPVGLKDVYAVAGRPLTASSRVLDEIPSTDCDVWRRLRAAGMVLVGHLHTHEFAAGASTDQVGNPWNLARVAGGSSGGSAAALAARMVPAATGTDTGGSLRIPSALCGTSSIKPTRGLVSFAGIVPLSPTLDHAGPMARTLADCALLLREMTGTDGPVASRALRDTSPRDRSPRRGSRPLEGVRLARSPRVDAIALDPDVADGYERACVACEELGATIHDAERPPGVVLDIRDQFTEILETGMLAYHARFRDRRMDYRPSVRRGLERAEATALSAADHVGVQTSRQDLAARWSAWLAARSIDAMIEPTVPVVAPVRGEGYQKTSGPETSAYIAFTHYWNWTGFPAITVPVGLGLRSALPVGVSLIGPAGSDWPLLGLGIELQARLGVPAPPA